MMFHKKHVRQPYRVGGQRKSLVISLPAKTIKECNIDPSTVLGFNLDKKKNSITLSILNAPNDDYNNTTLSAGEGFEAFNQQIRPEPQ
jgi:hypothetical protein